MTNGEKRKNQDVIIIIIFLKENSFTCNEVNLAYLGPRSRL